MTSSRIAPQRIHPVLLVLLAALAGCEGSGPSIGPSVDSNSNWLIECHTHSDCPSGTGVCMTGICLQPQVFAADPENQRCVDACEESVRNHLLDPCLTNGEPAEVCVAHADELVATCRADCARLHGSETTPGEIGRLVEPDGPAPDPPPSVEDENTTACWRSCVDSAFPALVACRDAPDASEEACLNDFYATVNRCGAGCDTTGEAGEPEPLPFGVYRAFLCDQTVVIQSDAIASSDALANCRLNAFSNPNRGLICTWNDEVIYNGCGGEGASVTGPEACEGWERVTLDRAEEFVDATYWSAEEMTCAGASFRRYDVRFGLWVGLVSCGAGYRFYLSETVEGPYLPAADGGGHGQDLCELVDPSFSIPIDSDITSGGCTTCAISRNYSFVAGEVFWRTAFGEPFRRAEAAAWGNYQSAVIQCASGPVECGLPSPPGDCELDPLGCR
jgi:hypothetical protein